MMQMKTKKILALDMIKNGSLMEVSAWGSAQYPRNEVVQGLLQSYDIMLKELQVLNCNYGWSGSVTMDIATTNVRF